MPRSREERLAWQREYNRRPERMAAKAAWKRANRDKENETRRRYVARVGRKPRPKERPGIPEDQDGKCYLCEQPLPLERSQMAMDHDHGHCGPDRSCAICRRGLAHNNCNIAIGLLGDNPEVIRHVADNLERAKAAVQQRIREAPETLALF